MKRPIRDHAPPTLLQALHYFYRIVKGRVYYDFPVVI
uniref:Uncharacterized protein n=1 Tax=Anguilla anguilla TaxID=7936 RepID=A0A0E9RH49_ANGAN